MIPTLPLQNVFKYAEEEGEKKKDESSRIPRGQFF